jgi:CRP-like cAMP-binding protein
MEKDHKIELLRGVPLFSACSKDSLKRIVGLVDEIDLPAGHVLTEQGRLGAEFFVIVNGTVRVMQDGRLVNTIGPGGFLGEISLVDHRPRTATATCETPCRVLVLGHREFHTLLADTPSIAVAVLTALAERVRTLEPKAAD